MRACQPKEFARPGPLRCAFAIAICRFGRPLEPRQIGEACRISSPRLAGLFARTEDVALVKRERLADDHRRVRVALTAKSRTLAAAMAPRIQAVCAAIEAHIGSEFVRRFCATLDDLLGLLDGVPGLEGE